MFFMGVSPQKEALLSPESLRIPARKSSHSAVFLGKSVFIYLHRAGVFV